MQQERQCHRFAVLGILLLATGCRRVEQQVDAAGALLVVLYIGFCALQLALPRIHELPWFQGWRPVLQRLAIVGAIGALALGSLRLISAMRAEHYRTIEMGIALVTLSLGLWLFLWATASVKEEQAKYAKLAIFSITCVIGLFYLLHNGKRLF